MNVYRSSIVFHSKCVLGTLSGGMVILVAIALSVVSAKG